MTISENRYFNSAALPMAVMDPYRNKFITANQEACRLLSMDLVQLRETTVSQIFSTSLPDLIVFSQEVIEHGRGWCGHLIVKNGQQTDINVEIHARSEVAGDNVYIHYSLQAVDELNQIREKSYAQQHFQSGMGHWNRVTSVFQEFERENQLLLDAAGEGIYGVDAQGITTFVNPAAQRILGYSAEELAGRNMHSMVHHSHKDGSCFNVEDCPIFAAFRDGTVHRVDDDIFWNKNGDPVDVEYTSTPITDNGFLVGAVVIFRDVSEKKKDQRKLIEALEEVKKLKNRLELENAYLQEEISSEFNHKQIIGRSSAIQTILQQINLVAPTSATVLINGESGTGKELIARAIHDASDRSNRSLIRVNCAAIPEELFESEFFGHAKGAFTGALADRPGRFELADGGTLFLDEVGEIPVHLQGKLLRVLQEQQFERIGESSTRNVDVRIIAATNRDLRALVEDGAFREDLYFRLNVFPIVSIPLRQRRDDIPLLAQHFLHKASLRANKTGMKIALSELNKLTHYAWPGNIRELENVIERQVILARGDVVVFPDLNPEMVDLERTTYSPNGTSTRKIAEKGSVEVDIVTEQERKQLEIESITNALKVCYGKVSGKDGAAAMLGVNSNTLTSRIRKFNLNPSNFKRKKTDNYKFDPVTI